MADTQVNQTSGNGGGSGGIWALVIVVIVLIIGAALYFGGALGGGERDTNVDVNIEAPATGDGNDGGSDQGRR